MLKPSEILSAAYAAMEAASESERPAFERAIDELKGRWARNPLGRFEPHSVPQLEFFEARTPVVAAFAGNRFGKTTSLVVRSLLECAPLELVPEHLREFKRFEAPVHGWIVCPTTDKMYDSLQPAFKKWVPQDMWRKGAWDTTWSRERRMLTFSNGSTISFKTYEQDASTLGGAALHFVGYDEPPPRAHRDECMTRLLDYGGYEMFAMTPLKTNTGWVRREIFKKREAPHITVVRGSMHDNKLLDERQKKVALESYGSDLWRRAREFGDFVEVGGLIYPDFERSVEKKPFGQELVRRLDVVVGIDPGIRNAGIVWVGFDDENVAYVFAEALLQDKTPKEYAQRIRKVNALWGLGDDVMYVVDPAARQRGQTNAETVLNLLIQERIPASPGQNDRDAGFAQLRTRMAYGRFKVSPDCRGLRDEADDYAAEEPDEGKDDSHLVPIKGNDHRLDALRYACMQRVWHPGAEDSAADSNLGWEPNKAPAASWLRSSSPRGGGSPMGSMS